MAHEIGGLTGVTQRQQKRCQEGYIHYVHVWRSSDVYSSPFCFVASVVVKLRRDSLLS